MRRLARSQWIAGACVAVTVLVGLISQGVILRSLNLSSAVSDARTTVGSPPRCATGTRDVTVSTAPGLRRALADASAGTVIRLADGIYSGRFVLTASGTPDRPITLCGRREAVLDGGSLTTGYVLHLKGARHWKLSGFTVTRGLKGVMTDGAHFNEIAELRVHGIGDEGVHFRAFSTHNVLTRSVIHGTGLNVASRGEGVYIGSAYNSWCRYTNCLPDASNENQVTDNVIGPATTAESVDVKEGTLGGLIRGNVFYGEGMSAADSWVDVKGNAYAVTDNDGTGAPVDGFQTHVQLTGWGNDNTFSGNRARVDGSGYGFRIKEGSARNVVSCDNWVENAALGFANVDCVDTH